MFHISLIFNIKCCDFKGKKKSQDYGGPSLCQVFAAFLGGNIHQSVFSMGRCNWHYQPRSVDEAIGLWGSAICWSMFSNKGGRGRRTPKSHHIWGVPASLPQPRHQVCHPMTWVMTHDLQPWSSILPLPALHLPGPPSQLQAWPLWETLLSLCSVSCFAHSQAASEIVQL